MQQSLVITASWNGGEEYSSSSTNDNCCYSTAVCETDSLSPHFHSCTISKHHTTWFTVQFGSSKPCYTAVNLDTQIWAWFGSWQSIVQSELSWMHVPVKTWYVGINLWLQERATFLGKQMELHKNHCKHFLQHWKCQLLCIQCTVTPTGISLGWCFP